MAVMSFELDHLFICTDIDAPEADCLITLGDGAAYALGYKLQSLSERAGLALALHEAQAFTDF